MVNSRNYILIEVTEQNYILAQKHLFALGYIWNTGYASIKEIDFKDSKMCFCLYKDSHESRIIKKMLCKSIFYKEKTYFKQQPNYSYFIFLVKQKCPKGA